MLRRLILYSPTKPWPWPSGLLVLLIPGQVCYEGSSLLPPSIPSSTDPNSDLNSLSECLFFFDSICAMYPRLPGRHMP